jgi:dihydroxyacetone kinase
MSKRKAAHVHGEWKQNPMQSVNNHKFLNDPTDAVVESLQGFVQTHPNCQLLDGLPDIKVVVRANTLLSNVDKNKVALISGGGSGHEPAHAGFVGEGVLNAAVCGDVFASPSVDAVLAAIRHVCGPNGCLLIVKNYTGDRLNFGLAAERAKLEGYKVEMVVVGDDCALPPPLGVAGRRGLAGTLFVHKVAGAAANSGLSLTAVKLEALQAAASVGTVGVAVAAHTVPGASAPARRIPGGRMEIGLGIHGEPGAFCVPVENVDTVVDALLTRITDETTGYMRCLEGKMRAPETGLKKVETELVNPPKGFPATKVAVMINSLGAVPPMELFVAAKAAREWLKNRGLHPARLYVGAFMTALNMTGFSISLCVLDQQRLNRLDADAVSTAWPSVARSEAALVPMLPSFSESDRARVSTRNPPTVSKAELPIPKTWLGRLVLTCVARASERLLAIAKDLTEADTEVGDGDCGTTFARGARALLEDVPRISGTLDTPTEIAVALGRTVRRSMGGTSGALYDIFFAAAGVAMEGLRDDDPLTFFRGFEAGYDAMRKYGGAQPGHRTMLDALAPALEAARTVLCARELRASSGKEALEAAAKAAKEGAEATRTMAAGAGRSSYVPAHVLASVEDPGATAAAAWIRGVADAAQEYL